MKKLQSVPYCFLGLLAGLAVTAQAESGFYRPLTLAPAEEETAGGGGGTQVSPEPPAADDHEKLAKKLNNPVASLISVPFQNNFDFGAGPNSDGFQWKMNFQPVIPLSISKDWNYIVRPIVPFVNQSDIAGTPQNPSGNQSGLGDTVVETFFSPKAPGPGGIIWGIGPAMLMPTASDDLLGTGKWGMGPTAVALKQTGPWTYGCLVNHIWSVAGSEDRRSVSSTYCQPFLVYTTPKAVSISLNAEASYNWQASHDKWNNPWSVPLNLGVSKIVPIGGHPVSFQVGGRYYVVNPDYGPDWGFRFNVTFLFPKK